MPHTTLHGTRSILAEWTGDLSLLIQRTKVAANKGKLEADAFQGDENVRILNKVQQRRCLGMHLSTNHSQRSHIAMLAALPANCS